MRGLKALLDGYRKEFGSDKNADYIVLNDASALNARSISVRLLDGTGELARWTLRPKSVVARHLVRLLG